MSEDRVLRHYHVDVFAGEERRYVRGFVLREMEDGWQILDDFGLAGERDRVVAGGMPLEEALVEALSILHGIFGPPLSPVWGTAPYELVGYLAPTAGFWHPWRLGKGALPQTRVGPDGRPEGPR